MRHQNCIFHKPLEQVLWHRFDVLLAEHGADNRVCRLPNKSQFIALIYVQLSDAPNLRAIKTALSSYRVKL